MSYDYLYYLSLFEVILKYYDELMSVRSTTGQIDKWAIFGGGHDVEYDDGKW